jgi:hypothetical protein
MIIHEQTKNAMEKQEIIKTNIYWVNAETFGKITILHQTEKAVLVVYSQFIRKGTSLTSKRIEREQWIPKSIWQNAKNFIESKYMGEGDLIKCFNPPYFIR